MGTYRRLPRVAPGIHRRQPGDAPGTYRGHTVHDKEADMDEKKAQDIAEAFYGKHPEAVPDRKAKKAPARTGKVFTHTCGRLFKY